jgi:reductive dehalogenase
VTERELLDPTDEIDWDILTRYDRRWQSQTRRIQTYFSESYSRRSADSDAGSAIRAQRYANQEPGFDHKARAFSGAVRTNRAHSFDASWEGPVDLAWADTPEEMGLPKWQGTPEEASQMLRAAMRFFGASHMGFADLDNTWRNKLVIAYTTAGARNMDWGDGSLPSDADSVRIVYENVDRGYEGENGAKWVVPTKQMSLIVAGMPTARHFAKFDASLFPGPNSTGRNEEAVVYAGTFQFLRGLGYQFLSDWGHQTDPTNVGASSVLTGIGESSRQNNYWLTPEYGNASYVQSAFTDLPLAPTNPIDAGMWKFCQSCHMCSRSCPAESIDDSNEPSWEPEPYENKAVTFHCLGVKHFWNNMIKCQDTRRKINGCNRCWGNCTFSTARGAMVHDIIRGTIAQTSLMNGFFYSLGETFGYGQMENPDDWWKMNLPVFGYDGTAVASLK